MPTSSQGWLRASHRKLDKKLSLPYRPYHTHDKKQPLTKGKPVELDIEIWPTSIAIRYRIGLSVRGKDYEYGGASGGKLSNFKNELTGCGPFLHNDPRDRPPTAFNGTTTLHFSGGKAAYMLLPICCCRYAAADHSAERTGKQQTARAEINFDGAFRDASQRVRAKRGPMTGSAIGRALMTNPDCLIMDEPSEGLAPIIIQGPWEAIGKLKKEGLSILVEQSAHLALKLVDYLHVMSKGQVVYSAKPDELKANNEIKSSDLGI